VHRIASTARISPHADIEDSVRGSVLTIGERCEVDSFVKIKFTGGMGDIVLGSHVYLNSGCILYSGNGIRIGNDVLVAANVVFAPTNHEFGRRDIPIREQRFRPSKGGILIEDDVWIGAGCILLDGAVVRRGAVVAAGAVVRGEIGPYTIAAGNPATVIGRRGEEGD
jgi:acetyltransferase-like isoleucine patch superfamily enzyme